MNKKIPLSILVALCSITLFAQENSYWTEADRKYLIDNLTRSRDELLAETKGLSKEQWSFKESPDRWSINEVVEHIAIWELLLTHRISGQLANGPQPELVSEGIADSVKYNFIMEDKPHHSLEYTKPFTYTIPMGLNDLKNNVAWLLKMRNESIGFVSTTKDDLRVYFAKGNKSSTHQTYITVFGHTDRHLRQIRKIKQHPKYPKK